MLRRLGLRERLRSETKVPAVEARASAPGKVILVGEHFVVENQPAIAVALDLRARACARIIEGEFRVEVYSKNLSREDTFTPESADKSSPLYPAYYAALRTMEFIGIKKPVRIEIDSEIPPAAGMGSSASVAVATVAAVSAALGVRLAKEDISRLAYEAEVLVHGKPSGIDNTIATYGGAIAYRKTEGFIELEADFSPVALVLADSGIPRNTGEMVRKVRALLKKYPRVMEPLYHAAGHLAIEAGKAIEAGDFERLGELMNINHGFLSAVGVSNLTLERMVYKAREAGALGAKITGAGGGGFIVALCWKEDAEKVAGALREVSSRVIVGRVAEEGVSVETET